MKNAANPRLAYAFAWAVLTFATSVWAQAQAEVDAAGVAARGSATIATFDESGAKHVIDGAALAKLDQQAVTVKDGDAEQVFEGVWLTDLLKSVGVGFGDRLKGPRAATVVLCEAADKYRVVF